MKTRIIVTRRSSDYHACVEGHTGIWACGPEIESAVDNLVSAWREEFPDGIEVVYQYVPLALRAPTEATP